VPEVIDKALFRASLAQVDWLLLHQANQRILDAVAEREYSESQSYQQSAHYGNTSAASIPRPR